MRLPLHFSAAVLFASLAHAQTTPADAPPALPVTPPVAPSTPVKPSTPESLPLIPGGGASGGKMVPPSQSLKPRADDATIAKSPSDISTYPKRYIALLGQAISSFHVRDFRGAIATLNKADEIMPATPWSLNTRGAIDIEQKNWAEGARNCMEALRIDPNFYPAKFNLCEIPFYQGKYAEARAMWERLLSQQPKDELLMYRIFFTYLLEGDIINTDAWLKKIPFPSETPAYQYAHLAFFMYQQKEAEKINDRNRAKQAADKVEEWTKSAEFIWPEQKRANFIDVFIQLGWMKRTDLATQ